MPTPTLFPLDALTGRVAGKKLQCPNTTRNSSRERKALAGSCSAKDLGSRLAEGQFIVVTHGPELSGVGELMPTPATQSITVHHRQPR